MNFRKVAVVDFETFPIRTRPDYPPDSVGVALWVPGKKPCYLAWGHPGGGNTCTKADGRAALAEIWDSDLDVLFHSSKFDCCVAEERMNLAPLPWKRVHDTMPMLFLDNPRAPTFSLKPSAERLLGEPPSERDAVEDWLMEHQPVLGVRLSKSKKSENYVGAYIAYAPVELVGPYAIGDVTRTRKLACKLYPDLKRRGMVEAYDRERRLGPVVREMEERGIRVDLKALKKDVLTYHIALANLDAWLCKKYFNFLQSQASKLARTI